MPAASGHFAGAAGADRAADSSSTPATAQKILNGVGCKRCCRASPMATASPKAISSRTAGQAASPSDCMIRSAKVAPAPPSQLVGAWLDAAFQLGSAGFHEIRATSRRAASMACSTPLNRTAKGAAQTMRTVLQTRWPSARAADMKANP